MAEYKVKDWNALYWLLYDLAGYVDGERSSCWHSSTECEDNLKKAFGMYPYNEQGKKDGYR